MAQPKNIGKERAKTGTGAGLQFRKMSICVRDLLNVGSHPGWRVISQAL